MQAGQSFLHGRISNMTKGLDSPLSEGSPPIRRGARIDLAGDNLTVRPLITLLPLS
jgi:hypothetical protein